MCPFCFTFPAHLLRRCAKFSHLHGQNLAKLLHLPEVFKNGPSLAAFDNSLEPDSFLYQKRSLSPSLRTNLLSLLAYFSQLGYEETIYFRDDLWLIRSSICGKGSPHRSRRHGEESAAQEKQALHTIHFTVQAFPWRIVHRPLPSPLFRPGGLVAAHRPSRGRWF